MGIVGSRGSVARQIINSCARQHALGGAVAVASGREAIFHPPKNGGGCGCKTQMQKMYGIYNIVLPNMNGDFVW